MSINLIHLSNTGRYIGSEVPINVVVFGLPNVQAGDTIRIELRSGSNVIYKYIDILAQRDIAYQHTIPVNEFIGLTAGRYVIAAILNDSVSISAAYDVVPVPVVSLTAFTPNSLYVPLRSPVTLTGLFSITGSKMNAISGSSRIAGTELITNINQLAQEG